MSVRTGQDSLSVEVIAADALTPELAAEWGRIQASLPEPGHPMLSAEFVRCIGRHRPGVRIAVLRSPDGVAGFFPYQTEADRTAWPVGYRINDFQGAIVAPGTELDPRWLLGECGLSAWHFDHLPTSQRAFAEGHFIVEEAPVIDLSGGFETYLAALSGRARWKSNERNQHYLARDVGPVRLEFHTTDEAAYSALLEWKSAQLGRNGRRCVFDWPWVRGVLEELRHGADPACTGTLSVLYAGDRIAAVHLGVRSPDVLHWWITAYEPALAKYSPGMLLLVRVIEEAAERGLKRIDLGKGMEPYKAKLQTGSIPLATGAVSRQPWRRMALRALYTFREGIRTGPLGAPASRLSYWLESRKNRGR